MTNMLMKLLPATKSCGNVFGCISAYVCNALMFKSLEAIFCMHVYVQGTHIKFIYEGHWVAGHRHEMYPTTCRLKWQNDCNCSICNDKSTSGYDATQVPARWWNGNTALACGTQTLILLIRWVCKLHTSNPQRDHVMTGILCITFADEEQFFFEYNKLSKSV